MQELEARRTDDVIVRSTINLGHALNLKVVAEGVELPYSWNALERLGCDLVQGYFVAKPMPAAEFTAWASGRTAAPSPVIPARVRSAAPMSAGAIDACLVDDEATIVFSPGRARRTS